MQAWLRARLAELSEAQALRDPADAQARDSFQGAAGETWLDACSNDYLGLGARPVSRETLLALEGRRIGAGASRLVQGTFSEHQELEAELADWVGTEGALTTPSAFAANAGTLPALCDADSLIVSDALNHASIVDGCRLSRARVIVTPHLELAAVEAALRDRVARGPAWVVVEGLFSMDGDEPDLGELRAVCDRHGAGLIVDEAHSLGVLGPQGAGLAARAGVKPDVLVAGLGKAVGSQGGFIAGSSELRTWLWNRARSFVFSTGVSPLLARATLEQVRATRRAGEARRRLAARSDELRTALTERGLALVGGSRGPIVPVLLGSNERALRAVGVLRARGILAQAIRPPTVPPGTARIRLTAHAEWPDGAAARIADALEQACG